MMPILEEIERRLTVFDYYQKWRIGRRWIPRMLRPVAFRVLAKKKVRKEIWTKKS